MKTAAGFTGSRGKDPCLLWRRRFLRLTGPTGPKVDVILDSPPPRESLRIKCPCRRRRKKSKALRNYPPFSASPDLHTVISPTTSESVKDASLSSMAFCTSASFPSSAWWISLPTGHRGLGCSWKWKRPSSFKFSVAS